MSRTPVRPYLITPDAEGAFRITIRETRFNSQNYPIVTSTLQDEAFHSERAARAHAKLHFAADASQIAIK